MDATLRRALACCAIILDYLLVADMRKEADGALLERIEEELSCLNKYRPRDIQDNERFWEFLSCEYVYTAPATLPKLASLLHTAT